jgi:hypothetical protein
MRPSHRTAHTLIVGIACAALGACGGGSSSATAVDAAFRSRADAVCASSLAVRRRHPFPLKNFNPTAHPTPFQLTVVADYFTTYGTAAQTNNGLARLGEPAHGTATWDALRALLRQDEATGSAQITIARSGDVSGFVASVHRGARLHARIVSVGRTAGFPASSACARYVG